MVLSTMWHATPRIATRSPAHSTMREGSNASRPPSCSKQFTASMGYASRCASAPLRRPVGEFPMRRHRGESEFVHQRQHRLAARADRHVGAVEGVAVVQRQHRAGTFATHVAEQGRDTGQAAARAVSDAERPPERLGVRLQVAVQVVQLQDGEVPGGHGAGAIQPCGLVAISRQYCCSSCGRSGGQTPHWRLPGTAWSMNFG